MRHLNRIHWPYQYSIPKVNVTEALEACKRSIGAVHRDWLYCNISGIPVFSFKTEESVILFKLLLGEVNEFY